MGEKLLLCTHTHWLTQFHPMHSRRSPEPYRRSFEADSLTESTVKNSMAKIQQKSGRIHANDNNGLLPLGCAIGEKGDIYSIISNAAPNYLDFHFTHSLSLSPFLLRRKCSTIRFFQSFRFNELHMLQSNCYVTVAFWSIHRQTICTALWKSQPLHLPMCIRRFRFRSFSHSSHSHTSIFIATHIEIYGFLPNSRVTRIICR